METGSTSHDIAWNALLMLHTVYILTWPGTPCLWVKGQENISQTVL